MLASLKIPEMEMVRGLLCVLARLHEYTLMDTCSSISRMSLRLRTKATGHVFRRQLPICRFLLPLRFARMGERCETGGKHGQT
jgi:hypothetical protein